MKHLVRASFLHLILFSVSSLASIQVKGVNPEELVQPGDYIGGTLSRQNTQDSYGMKSLELGLYNISLVSYGDTTSQVIKRKWGLYPHMYF